MPRAVACEMSPCWTKSANLVELNVLERAEPGIGVAARGVWLGVVTVLAMLNGVAAPLVVAWRWGGCAAAAAAAGAPGAAGALGLRGPRLGRRRLAWPCWADC